MQAVSAAITGASIAAAGTYQLYHAVWKSRDSIAEASSLYAFKPDPASRELPPKRLHDEVSRKFTGHTVLRVAQ
ncbi:hypothetical protein T492DRAFT_900007 [Pavlovales sp. CCMP2436]|nr:hypothetical protein T492DRAFT_900007 [Pavlovales sp. CCMP2436]